MKEIDRRGRTLTRVIMWGFWLQLHVFLVIAFCDDHKLGDRLFFVGISVVLTVITLYCGHYATPRAYFSDGGVYLKRFFRKKFYPWGDMQQAVIVKRVVHYGHRHFDLLSRQTRTYYQFYLLTKDGSAWTSLDTERKYRWRNRKHLLLIPLTDESKEYVKLHHVKLAVDQSKGKKIRWRMVK